MKRRFVAQSQGDLQAVWNVLDTKTKTYRKFALTGEGAKEACVALAKRLNNDRRYQPKNRVRVFEIDSDAKGNLVTRRYYK